ncbi:uncharacterized protein [Chelonus insularis]|uniref:uncharacterized protein n=1 Tax=Chelonus insularis TaxID=460826 RepID=UPI001588C940|nr:uncharacterized protein LOC118071521 [Chelonus insularis]
MKYPSLSIIINVLAIFITYSSADDLSDPDVKKVYARADRGIETRPTELDDAHYLLADLTLTDENGDNVDIIESEMLLRLDIKLKTDATDEKYEDGRVTYCDIAETNDSDNIQQLYNECEVNENIERWTWDKELQNFSTNLIITKLSESISDRFTIKCLAVVCREQCPVFSCNKTDVGGRRKRTVFLSSLKQSLSSLPSNIYRGIKNRINRWSASGDSKSTEIPSKTTMAPSSNTKKA